MKSRPSQYARPRLATIPKFLKIATLSGFQLPDHVAGERVSAKTLSSFVVTKSLPPIASGYDC